MLCLLNSHLGLLNSCSPNIHKPLYKNRYRVAEATRYLFLIDHNSLCSEFRKREACVSFKIAVQVTLVGELEFVYKFLETFVGIH